MIVIDRLASHSTNEDTTSRRTFLFNAVAAQTDLLQTFNAIHEFFIRKKKPSVVAVLINGRPSIRRSPKIFHEKREREREREKRQETQCWTRNPIHYVAHFLSSQCFRSHWPAAASGHVVQQTGRHGNHGRSFSFFFFGGGGGLG